MQNKFIQISGGFPYTRRPIMLKTIASQLESSDSLLDDLYLP